MGTGIAELDAIIRATNKKFKKDFSGQVYPDPLPLPTGSLYLDEALGIGGLPKGRVIEIFGWESSGKTSLALCALAHAQQERKKLGINKRDLIVDMEYSLSESFIEGFGIDLEQVIWVRPDTAEEALTLCIDYPKSGAIDCLLFDSVDAAQNQRQLGRDVGDDDVGGISKLMSFTMRQLSKIAAKTDTTCIFINQVREKPSLYGGKTTPGGNALKFYASLRLEVLKSKPVSELPNSFLMRVVIVKTKVDRPWGKDPIEILFEYGVGPNVAYDLTTLCFKKGILRQAGASIQRKQGGEYATIFKGKRAEFVTELRSDRELFNALRSECFLLPG